MSFHRKETEKNELVVRPVILFLFGPGARDFLEESGTLLRVLHGNRLDGTLEHKEVLGVDVDSKLFQFLQILLG